MKLIRRWNRKNGKKVSVELYNLAEDLSESKNLVQEKAEIASELETLMDSARNNSKEFKMPYDKPRA